MSMSRIQVHFSCFFFTFFCVGGGGVSNRETMPLFGWPKLQFSIVNGSYGGRWYAWEGGC